MGKFKQAFAQMVIKKVKTKIWIPISLCKRGKIVTDKYGFDWKIIKPLSSLKTLTYSETRFLED